MNFGNEMIRMSDAMAAVDAGYAAFIADLPDHLPTKGIERAAAHIAASLIKVALMESPTNTIRVESFNAPAPADDIQNMPRDAATGTEG